jgi:hypothetical protein
MTTSPEAIFTDPSLDRKSFDAAIHHLSEHDHSTGSPEGGDSSAFHFQVIDSLISQLSAKISGTTESPDHAGIEQFIAGLKAAKEGYAYRQEHRLPGLTKQFQDAEDAYGQGGESSLALQELHQQPDAAALLEKLRERRELIDSVRAAGGVYDLDGLLEEVGSINLPKAKLSTLSSADLSAQIRLIDRLGAQASASEPLAVVKRTTEFVPSILKTLAESRGRTVTAYINSLERSFSNLSLAAGSRDLDPGFAHAGKLEELARQENYPGLLEESLAWMARAAGIDPVAVMAEGLDLDKLGEQRLRISTRLQELHGANALVSFNLLDFLPIIGPRRRQRQDREREEFYNLQSQDKELAYLQSIAPSVNDLRQFRLYEDGRLAPQNSEPPSTK